MDGFQFSADSISAFSGPAKLFPLLGVAIFPHVIQPLHVFETRYQDLLVDALKSDRLIAMATLQAGWETNYDDRPAVESTVCLGQIVGHHSLDDGRHNILLAGQQRARIIEEVESNKLYRLVQLELLDDIYPQHSDCDRNQLRRQLVDGFRSMISDTLELQANIDQLLDEKISLGTLTDIIAHSLNLPIPVQRQLLVKLNVDQRAMQLLDHLEASVAAFAEPSTAIFPPPFSLN